MTWEAGPILPRGAGLTPLSLQGPEQHHGAGTLVTLTPAGGASVTGLVLWEGGGAPQKREGEKWARLCGAAEPREESGA